MSQDRPTSAGSLIMGSGRSPSSMTPLFLNIAAFIINTPSTPLNYSNFVSREMYTLWYRKCRQHKIWLV